jgi:hypothetical protein
MTIDAIKAAVDAGRTVHWANTGYVVIRDSLGEYLIRYTPNGHCIGLTNRAGDKLNGAPEQFFIA